MSPRPEPAITRRDLLRTAGALGATMAIPPSVRSGHIPPPRVPGETSMLGVPFARHDRVRLAIVGTGGRGTGMLGEWLAVDGVEITALSDIVPAHAQRAAKMVTDAGRPAPALYTNGERDFEHLVTRDDIDIVYTATPWDWHVPVCLAAMRAGKHAATEVPAMTTLEDAWELVRTSESTRRHCLMMENCCYGFNEMLIDTMVKAGRFGEVLYAEAAYLHDLRSLLFADEGEGLWRRFPHTERNGNFYPTHGLGPVAWYLDIHRRDRFDYLVSMSTPERGLTEWRAAHVAKDSSKWNETYVEGDLNTSLIKTVQGKTILLQHCVTLPTPYSRLNAIRGTRGLFEDYPPRIHLEGQPGGEAWAPLSDELKAQYTHPLWARVGEVAKAKGGHGGMDYVMAWRLIETMREGLPPDFDVYDAAAWSAPGPLSEASLALSSAPVRFPDFTRGAWTPGGAK